MSLPPRRSLLVALFCLSGCPSDGSDTNNASADSLSSDTIGTTAMGDGDGDPATGGDGDECPAPEGVEVEFSVTGFAPSESVDLSVFCQLGGVTDLAPGTRIELIECGEQGGADSYTIEWRSTPESTPGLPNGTLYMRYVQEAGGRWLDLRFGPPEPPFEPSALSLLQAVDGPLQPSVPFGESTPQHSADESPECDWFESPDGCTRRLAIRYDDLSVVDGLSGEEPGNGSKEVLIVEQALERHSSCDAPETPTQELLYGYLLEML